MSALTGAPKLKSDWKRQLALLNVTQDAIGTLGSFSVVPTSDGGIQLEVHRDGLDFEMEIGPDGKIESVLVGRAKFEVGNPDARRTSAGPST